ncbi:MAG: metallophosphoesterase family protein [Bacteroidota bacterium]|nr:metallophosphoesterase family protein [Bacteroidota bacterium]
MITKNVFLVLSAVATLLFSVQTFAQPQQIHLSWNSTAKNATENTMAITWADNHLTKGVVKFGMGSQLLKTENAAGKYSDTGKIYIYKATLKRLKPNTSYHYKCGSEKGGWSEDFTFKTAPALGSKSKFMVGVWGDTQDNEFNEQFQKTKGVVQQLKKYPIRFMVHMGDIVDNGSVGKKWNGLFAAIQPVAAYAPLMPVTGNHDVDNDSTHEGYQKPFPVFYDFLNLPANNIDYSYNYGNTHFVAISSGHAKGAEAAGAFTFAPGSSEYRWLEDDLAKARADKKITWIILYMHHPLYSFGWSHVQGWQNRITPLVDKYKVDLCLAGHRHVYERHRAIRSNTVVPQADSHTYQAPQGTVYITNGTAGGSPQGLGGKDMPSIIFTNGDKMYNYAIMTIEGKTINYDVYNQDGNKIDYFTLNK